MAVFRSARHFPVPPEAVFAAIGNPASLAQWWGPAGFTNTFHAFEFRVGGRWIFTMHGPDGTNFPNEAEFIELIPTRKVVIRHLAKPHFQLAIDLQPDEGGTLLTWTQTFDDPTVATTLRHILEPANEQNLDRLSEVVAPSERIQP